MKVMKSLFFWGFFCIAGVLIKPVVAMDNEVDVSLDSSAEKSGYLAARDAFVYSTDIFADNFELIRALSCLLYLPDVVFADSTKPCLLRTGAASALVAENIKLLHYLFSKKEIRPIIELLWHMPKAALYGMAQMYDVVRFIDADSLARINGECSPIPSGNLIKINQGVQLAIEAVLRIFVCINSAQQERVTINADKNKHSFWLAELADVIELWRLMSRYSSHFKLIRHKNEKKQGQVSCAVSAAVNDLSECEAFGDAADFKNNLLSLVGTEKLDLALV